MRFRLRKAVPADTPTLLTLIRLSVRELQRNDYTPAQIEGALESVFGVDSALVVDGTYLVVETEEQDQQIIACGGWSKRKTLFGGDNWVHREDSVYLDPAQDPAKIRAFFVHPTWSRQGIGTLLLNACEEAAKSAGFTSFEMGATLTGVPLYLARGYVSLQNIQVPLANGEYLPIVRMAKKLS
jgi:GNAT superfamily N-acetyltransferase